VEAFLISTAVVAIAEIGDKTQLLAIVLAARFGRPVPIILGILVATLANHALAALAGYWAASFLAGPIFRYGLALSFIAMAVWALIPDKEDEGPVAAGKWGVFAATMIAFFFVEMGDKTQVATAALAARFQTVMLVTAGTTVGMMLANIPAVLLGERATKIAPLKLIRTIAAVIFLVLGIVALIDAIAQTRTA